MPASSILDRSFHPRSIAALLLSVAALAACEKAPPQAPVAAEITPAQPIAEMPGIPASGVDMSVPSASQALSGEPVANGAATADGNGPNQRSPMSNIQEQQSMPLPGQANDHSNTVTEDKKPASAPAR